MNVIHCKLLKFWMCRIKQEWERISGTKLRTFGILWSSVAASLMILAPVILAANVRLPVLKWTHTGAESSFPKCFTVKNPFNLVKLQRVWLWAALCIAHVFFSVLAARSTNRCSQLLLSKHTCHHHKYSWTVAPVLQTSGMWCRTVLKQATKCPQTWLLLVSVWLVRSGSDIFCDSTSILNTWRSVQ